LLRLAQADSDEPQALLDPCAVLDGGKWHVFATVKGGTMYYALDDWRADGKVQRGVRLPIGPDIVPQVFFHRATKKWNLIGMLQQKTGDLKRWAPCLSTNDNVAAPEGWSKPIVLEVPAPLDDNGKAVNWMDFYVIFDDDKAHLFATSAGKLWRSETKAGNYPQGWSKPEVALKGDVVYASHTYRQEADKGARFLTTVTGRSVDPATKKNKQYQQSYVADKLEGPWRPESAMADNPFAGFANIRIADPRWSGDLVHGEPLRKGNDERMLLERDIAGFIFHARAKLKNEEKAAAIDCIGVLRPVAK
jgi:hypothetical protein